MRNFIIRALTGITYAALLIGCTVFSPVTAFFFFAIVAFACVWEFCGLMNRHAGASLVPPLSALAAVILVAAVWLMCIGSENAVRHLMEEPRCSRKRPQDTRIEHSSFLCVRMQYIISVYASVESTLPVVHHPFLPETQDIGFEQNSCF